MTVRETSNLLKITMIDADRFTDKQGPYISRSPSQATENHKCESLN